MIIIRFIRLYHGYDRIRIHKSNCIIDMSIRIIPYNTIRYPKDL